ncbi:MAG: AAA family ATPase [Proteobacteria bacterium]|nr:AAA family ATPase [Pseudomonadota bacterium]
MYIQSIEISNLKSFSKLNLELDENTSKQGWHVIIGPNGSGKSSLVRAVAFALIGTPEVFGARPDTNSWIRSGQKEAILKLEIIEDNNYDYRAGSKILQGDFKILIDIKIKNLFVDSSSCDREYGDTIWRNEASGWFSAGFGPFRRFTGGNSDLHRLYSSHPRLARHLSLFGEDVALTEALTWLRDLRFKQLESQGQNNLIDKIKTFINQEGFLPFGAKLMGVNSAQVVFRDGAGVDIPVLELSDGYRSILSLTFELIRQMAACFPKHELFDETGMSIVIPGVVLIDEVDVHLHPNWQRAIGPWLCRLFPQVQFIVTTHSSFVCQEATSVWRLPDPGTDDEFKRVIGEELTQLKYGDATLALETHAFGLEQNRSDKANELLDELAALNLKASSGQLNDQEAKRHKELKTLLQPVLP